MGDHNFIRKKEGRGYRIVHLNVCSMPGLSVISMWCSTQKLPTVSTHGSPIPSVFLQQGWLAVPVKCSASSYPSKWQDVWHVSHFLPLKVEITVLRVQRWPKQIKIRMSLSHPPLASFPPDHHGRSVKALCPLQNILEVGHIHTYFNLAWCGKTRPWQCWAGTQRNGYFDAWEYTQDGCGGKEKKSLRG